MRFILFICILFSIPAQAQTAYTVKETIPLTPGINREELSHRASVWLGRFFSTADFKVYDVPSGIYAATNVLPFISSNLSGAKQASGIVVYDVNLYITDNSLTYEFTNFYHNSSAPPDVKYPPYNFGLISAGNTGPVQPIEKSWGRTWETEIINEVKKEINNHVNLVIASLKLALAQPVSIKENTIEKPVLEFKELVTLTGAVQAEELLKRARVWVMNPSREPSGFLRLISSKQNEIIGAFSMPYFNKADAGNTDLNGTISFNLGLTIDNTGYYYIITNFTYKSYAHSGVLITTENCAPNAKPACPVWNDIQRNIQATVPALVQSLKTAMATPIKED